MHRTVLFFMTLNHLFKVVCLFSDNFIGVLRRCYYLGTLPGIDETDGCKTYVLPPNNDTFQFCFCSKDYCNVTCTLASTSMLTLCGAAFAIYHILVVR